MLQTRFMPQRSAVDLVYHTCLMYM